MEDGACSYRRFLDGDEKAFDELIGLYRRSLIFFLNRYVHNWDTAEELAEDAFVELLLHPRRYDFSVSLKTYLFAIGRGKALNHRKWEKRHPAIELAQAEAYAQEQASIEDAFVRDEAGRQVDAALGTLRIEYRTVLHLRYFEELSNEEIAGVLHKNRRQVENLLCRARLALKAVLEKEGFSREER